MSMYQKITKKTTNKSNMSCGGDSLVLPVFVLLTSCTLCSVAAADSNRYYIVGGIGNSSMSPNTSRSTFTVDDGSDVGYNLNVGRDFARNTSVELSFTDMGATQLQPAAKLNYDTISASALYYAWNRGGRESRGRREGLSVYGRAGVGKLNNSSTAPFRQVNSAHLLLGAGVEYSLDNGFGARAEIVRFDEDASYGNLSLLYRFGDNSVADVKVDTAWSEPMPAPESFEELPILGEGEQTGDATLAAADLPVLYFDIDSTSLMSAGEEDLDFLVQRMNAEPDLAVVLVGHTDSKGSVEYNRKLASGRVLNVARYLVDQGIDIERMDAYSKGEDSLMDESDASLNRRVEIYQR